MMTRFCKILLATALMPLFPSLVMPEEAVDCSGKKFTGHFLKDKDTWTFHTAQGNSIPTEQLAHVRFDAKTTPLPRAALLHTLLLANGQRITGNLLRVDEQKL